MSKKSLDLPKDFFLGDKIDAKYLDQPDLPDHAGNPLLLALPPIWSSDAVLKVMRQAPNYDRDRDIQLPREKRSIKVKADLSNFFHPLPRHARLESEVSSMIRTGYNNRNPMTVLLHQQIEEHLKTLDSTLTKPVQRVTSTPTGLLSGLSGTGKSYTLERILRMTPQVIRHKEFQGTPFIRDQLVWLKISCPESGTPRGLCTHFFQTVDRALNTTYASDYGGSTSTVTWMVPGLARIALSHFLGLLVIDELQNLNAAKAGSADQLQNFLVQIENMGIPVLKVANGNVFKVVGQTFAGARRSSGVLAPHWHRMMDKSREWKSFCAGMWKYQYLKEFQPLTDDLRDELYYQTQGIPDLAVKLYINVQKELIFQAEDEVITPKLIASVAFRDFAGNARILQALRIKDPALVGNVKDVCVEDIVGAELPPEEIERLEQKKRKGAGKSTVSAMGHAEQQTA